VKGYAILVEGPSGSGKSHFLRSALLHYKSGAVALAPGDDEWASYIEFEDDERFTIQGFGDPLFLPSIKSWTANGHKELITWLKDTLKLNIEHFSEHGEPLHKVIGFDTFTGMGELALNQQMASLKIAGAPPSQSPDGAAFYGGYARAMREVATVGRAYRGLGIHWIATAHVVKREGQGGQMSSQSKEQIMPAFVGQFREQVPGIFDLVFHSGVTGKGKHYLLWKPEPKRVTKSRFGPLAEEKQIDNEWDTLVPLIEAAIVQRVEQSKSQLGG
jgi:hypothetical protein